MNEAVIQFSAIEQIFTALVPRDDGGGSVDAHSPEDVDAAAVPTSVEQKDKALNAAKTRRTTMTEDEEETADRCTYRARSRVSRVLKVG